MYAPVWILKLKNKIPLLLDRLKGQTTPGFFHYSLSSDFHSEKIKWGLGNTVFAVKIYYILNMIKSLPPLEKKEMISFIKSFQTGRERIFDPLVRRKALLRNLFGYFAENNFKNILGQQTILAETRQAISALNLLGAKNNLSFDHLPKTKTQIRRYLSQLNWHHPWHAGSHFSHLLFFLNQSDLPNKTSLIDHTVRLVSTLQNPEDGCWYQGRPSSLERINGAMKVCTGLKVAQKKQIPYARKLIDFCLAAPPGRQACDKLNRIYVLKYADNALEQKYRWAAIRKFAQNQLKIIRQYYYPQAGGFSLLPGKANVFYYGARLTQGLSEPDIHGTLIYLWAITLCAQILGFNRRLGFQELIP